MKTAEGKAGKAVPREIRFGIKLRRRNAKVKVETIENEGKMFYGFWRWCKVLLSRYTVELKSNAI